jgi:uncharacterized protein YkwD
VVLTRDTTTNKVSVQLEPLVGGKKGTVPKSAAQSQSLAQMEEAIRQRINQQRQKQGLQPLKANDTLRKIARNYSRRMRQEKFFSHYDAKGKSVSDRVLAAGIRYSAVGENLFKSYNLPNVIEGSVRGWMNSKGHRENILRRQYTETGVGIWKDGSTYHITQIFLKPK